MKNTLSGENHFLTPPDWINLKKKYKKLDWFLWKFLKPIQSWTETEHENLSPKGNIFLRKL